nr:MAG TPA: hypothetical protein [Caudoviricetes sp.]
MAGPFTLTATSWYGSAIIVFVPLRRFNSSTSSLVDTSVRKSFTPSPSFLVLFLFV